MRRLVVVVVVVAVLAGSGVAVVRHFRHSSPAKPPGDPKFLCTTATLATVSTVTLPSPPAVALTKISDVPEAIALATRPNDDFLYVATKLGEVIAVAPESGERTSILDLRDEVSTRFEQGLLGLVFSPDGSHMYLHYTDHHDAVNIDEFAVTAGALDRASRRQVLRIYKPSDQHNGGSMLFGPDGYLYIGIGDGGELDASGKPAYTGDQFDHGQRLDSLMGKVLRIDPTPKDGRPYQIPPDNPFVDVPTAAPEIWMWGLRNPWRFTLDQATGDIWLADDGHACWEEVNRLPLPATKGANFGWSRTEGMHGFRGEPPANEVLPIYEYRHSTDTEIPTPGGCAIIGGYAYHGASGAIADGTYVFTDLCDPRLWGLRVANGQTEVVALGAINSALPYSFGQDQRGELYVLGAAGIFRIDKG